MQRSFSDVFDFGTWEGIRAQEFSTPNDAFQQLVGDALREAFGAAAWVAATKGRDGGIDAFVDPSVTAIPARFSALRFSCIVECKYHDERAKGLKGNIEQEWERVATKVAAQAAAGWLGAYEPWRSAHGYLYCISARFPDQDFRQKFCNRIRDFFDSLPIDRRPPINREHIQVWDWADLADWFRGSGRLADRWLGIPLSDFVDHATYRRRVGQHDRGNRLGFRAYLLDEHLPFVQPPVEDDSHPDSLFDRMRHGESVLLIGEGGIGKTRTAFEVAERADKAGWRVLHLDPPDLGIDPRALLDELSRHIGRTLVVVDYVDKIQNFDARYWHRTLLPEVARRNGQLVLIANARPSDSQGMLEAVKASGLFREIRMSPSPERRRTVASEIQRRICPQALAALGSERVSELCGNRPIIAMFIARELEGLATEGQLNLALAAAPRPGDLVGWLRRRLREAGLVHEPKGSPLDVSPPSPGLCAATAVLAAAPMARTELMQVATATLTAMHGDVQRATVYIDFLRNSGWLEPDEHGLDLRTPHDIIADEALSRLLTTDSSAVPMVLASAKLGRPLGRFALSLGRLASSPNMADAASAVRGWLEREAATLGAELKNVRPDVSAYALGAVLDCPYWSEAATFRWHELVAPWLDAFGSELAARHLLYRGLKMTSVPVHLRDAALTWVAVHGKLEAAGFVLAPLLAWSHDRLGEEAETVVLEHALAWLADHGQAEPAQFVLHALLVWDEARLGTNQAKVLEHTLAWLANHGRAEAAKFAIHALLGWNETRLGANQGVVLQHALAWLADHGTTEAAGFTLNPLLAWNETRLETYQGMVFESALVWLADYGNTEAAGFVFPPLLAWGGTRLGTSQTTVLNYALAWLRLYAQLEGASFLLIPLIQWDEERIGAAWNDILSMSNEWLNKNLRKPVAGRVLSFLADFDEHRLGSARQWVLDSALKWLDAFGNDDSAGILLNSLLCWRKARLGDAESRLMAIASTWLKGNRDAKNADFIIGGLLLLRSLSTEDRQYWCEEAIKMVVGSSCPESFPLLLGNLVRAVNRFQDKLPYKEVMVLAGQWLDRNPNHPARVFLIGELLGASQFDTDVWKLLAETGLREIASRSPRRNDDYVLGGILRRIDVVDRDFCLRWATCAEEWLRNHSNSESAGFLMERAARAFSGRDTMDVLSRLQSAYQYRFRAGILPLMSG